MLLMRSLRVVLFSWRENFVVSSCATSLYLCCTVRQNLGCQDPPSFYFHGRGKSFAGRDPLIISEFNSVETYAIALCSRKARSV